MATLLHRLGTTAYRRWPLFLAAWFVALVAVGGVAATMARPFEDSFSIPGIPSEEAADLQAELFPGATDAFDEATVNVVVQAPEGHTLAEYDEQVDALVADLNAGPEVPADPAEQAMDPVTAAEVQASRMEAMGASAADIAATTPLTEDGRTGLITYAFDADSPMEVTEDAREHVFAALEDARDAGLVAEANGSGMTGMEEPGSSEMIGMAVALVVLVLTFGALVTAGLPIVSAIWGVALGMTGITAMTAFLDLGSSTPMLATMIGLAVGIDYALFILARYRAELERTDDREDAVGTAVGTAGSAVVFAGLTVLIALSALAVVRIPFLTAMGLAAAATVLIAVLVALTLLPALLGMLKSWAFKGRVRRYTPRRDDRGRVLNNGVRWAQLVGRRPVAAVLLVVVALGALAVPLKDLHLAFPTDSTASADTTQRKASDLVAAEFGPGREGPLMVVVDAGDAEDPAAAFRSVAAWAAGIDDVEHAMVGMTNAVMDEDGAVTQAPTGALVMVTPTHGPDDERTEDVLAELRGGESAIEEATGTDVGVTGMTAITTDVSERLADALPVYLAVVIGLAFILLMVVFRSVLVPLTATFGFLLSVLATLGATVAVFQEGAFGLMEGQPIVSFMPIFLIGLVFGLAMDYQVFLVTRMREAHVHGMSTREAVVDGFRNSARVVSAAAVIMISVFAAFMLSSDAIVKSMGFALAVAVFLDAFVVRMVLIPALMYLMGEKAWWLPGWLDRVLPNVDVEGEALLAARADDEWDHLDLDDDQDRVLV
jgi:RND superfamily putative drug exporter